MIRIKKLLSILFILAWVAGEAPRLWWGQAWPLRPMDLAAGLLFLADVISNKKYKSYKNVGLVIAAAILGPYTVRTFVYGWLIWRGREIFTPVKKWITPALAAFLVLGLAQYLFLPDMRFLLRSGWDEHYYRLVGTVLDPNYFGVMAGMAGLFAIQSASLDGVSSIRSARDPRLLRRRFSVNIKNRVSLSSSSMISETPSSARLLALLAFISLILTWSRASWTATAVGLWVGFGTGYVRRRLGMLGILGGLGVLIWLAAPKPGGEGVNLLRTASIEQRLVSAGRAIEVWKQSPWFGVGFSQSGSNLPAGSWLVILQATGIVGSAAAVIGGIRIIKEIKGDKFWLAIAIMLGVHAVFNNTLFYPPVLGLLALLRIRSLRLWMPGEG